MGVDIRLLGPPLIVVEGEPRRLKGRKSWELAKLLMEPHTTRRQLVDRLFADAEDPMATPLATPAGPSGLRAGRDT